MPIKSKLPDNFPKIFETESIVNTIYKILFSLENNRNVIIAGEEGVGKTQLAKWISKYWNQKYNNNEKEENEFFCICTENITCADLIGKQKASSQFNAGQEIIEWQSGFLLDAIEKGKCVVLDYLEEAPSTVTERLNSLLDKKYDGKDNIFYVYENPKKQEFIINNKFRLVCTCELENIKNMSPAFINRFDVIVLKIN